MNLLVVIVNYRTPELTIECLRSLAPEIAQIPDAKAVLVDNASGDDSVPRFREALAEHGWNAWLELLVLPENLGFAGGNNRGIEQHPDAKYVLLLNSDTIVHEGCLRYCWELMESSPDIGAMSCLLKNADGSPQNVSRRFPTPARMIFRTLGLPWKLPAWFEWADTEDLGWDRASVKRDVDWLGGAFLWMRGNMLRRIGLLSEDFFFYGEDIELCCRIMRAGYRRHYDPAVSITHLGGGSSDEDLVESETKARYSLRARYMVQRLCYGAAAAAALRAVDVAATAARLGHMRLRGRGDSPSYHSARLKLKLMTGRL